MRRAFELAWASAHLHARCRPVFRALDDITFLTPVEIGSIIKFESKVVYVPAGNEFAVVTNKHCSVQHGLREAFNGDKMLLLLLALAQIATIDQCWSRYWPRLRIR